MVEKWNEEKFKKEVYDKGRLAGVEFYSDTCPACRTLGVILDRDAYRSSDSTMERDVYKPMFLESKGWTLLRVWSRDWWLYPSKVIKAITSLAEANRSKSENS